MVRTTAATVTCEIITILYLLIMLLDSYYLKNIILINNKGAVSYCGGKYQVYSQLNADSNTIWPTKCLPFLSFELGRLGSECCSERENNMDVGR